MGLTVNASAAGKLFILGEYAVLHGAPALVAAVNVRARIRATPARAWRLDAPQLGIHGYRLAGDGGLPGDCRPARRQALAVFDAARHLAAREGVLPPLDIVIDTAAFFGAGGKLGLGASAAVAAALIGLFNAINHHSHTRKQLGRQAIAAHRLAQNGEGSGADVAAALLGGLVGYRLDQPRRHAWPAGLHARAVVTGNGADTRKLVAAVRRLQTRDPTTHGRCIERLCGLAETGYAAMSENNPAALLAAADGYFDALAALGRAARADIVTAAHHELRDLAAQQGCVFKPTGAGGGDLGLLLSDAPRTLEDCDRALAAAGHRCLPLRFGALGLRVVK